MHIQPVVLWRGRHIQSVALFSKAATAFCFPISNVRSSYSTASSACGIVCVLDVLYIHTHIHIYIHKYTCLCVWRSAVSNSFATP